MAWKREGFISHCSLACITTPPVFTSHSLGPLVLCVFYLYVLPRLPHQPVFLSFMTRLRSCRTVIIFRKLCPKSQVRPSTSPVRSFSAFPLVLYLYSYYDILKIYVLTSSPDWELLEGWVCLAYYQLSPGCQHRPDVELSKAAACIRRAGPTSLPWRVLCKTCSGPCCTLRTGSQWKYGVWTWWLKKD